MDSNLKAYLKASKNAGERMEKEHLDRKNKLTDIKNRLRKNIMLNKTDSKTKHEVELPKEKPKKENFKAYVEKFLSFPKDDLHEALEYFHSKPIKTYQNRFWEAFGDPTTLFFKFKRGEAEINVKPSKRTKKHKLDEVVKDLHAVIDKVNNHINDMNQGKKGTGMFANYFKPKGQRQLIFFSDSSSSDDEPQIPLKRGRGIPKCY